MAVYLSLFAGAGQQFFTNAGVPLAGGKIYTYGAGGSTPQATYTTSAGNIAHSNPIVLDAAGRVPGGGEIWLTDTLVYKFQLETSTGTIVQTLDNVSASIGSAALVASSGSNLIGFVQAGSGAIGRTVQSKLRDVISVLDFGADPTGIVDSTSAIQTAISAVPDGGTLFVPTGTYLLATATGSRLLQINKRLQIIGDGWSSKFLVGSSVAGTVDVIQIIAPGGGIQGIRLQDFHIAKQSGTPARHGISVDGTNDAVGYMVIDHVRIDQLGSNAFGVINASGLITGTPFITSIKDCILTGGANLTNAGDNIQFNNSQFGGTGSIIVDLVSGPSDGGAHGFLMTNCNITLSGGIVVKNAWQGAIEYCNIEQTVATTSANNALLDIQGNVAAPIENFKIYGNYLGGNNLYVADTVRVDRAVATIISDNYAIRGSGTTYNLTANANRTNIRNNRQAPSGELITTWLNDAGTNTNVVYNNENNGIPVITVPFSFATLAGTQIFYSTGAQNRYASNVSVGFASGTNPTSVGIDAGLSRSAAGVIAAGNGTVGDASGKFYASAFQFLSGSTLYSGSGAPGAFGINGDYYFRTDTPAVANQRIYVRSAGVWVGIL